MKVCRLERCEFTVCDRAWRFAEDRADAIARNWQRAQKCNPKLFNGDVFVTDDWSMSDDTLEGIVLRTKFAAYLYWRETGFDDGATHEAFASALVISSDGGVLLGRSSSGTLNAGQYLTPGGLIDRRDVVERQGVARLDLAGAAARELQEETGVSCRDLKRDGGFVVAQRSPFLAVASVFRSSRTSSELTAEVEAYLSRQAVPELEDIACVHTRGELDRLETTEFACLLARAVVA